MPPSLHHSLKEYLIFINSLPNLNFLLFLTFSPILFQYLQAIFLGFNYLFESIKKYHSQFFLSPLFFKIIDMPPFINSQFDILNKLQHEFIAIIFNYLLSFAYQDNLINASLFKLNLCFRSDLA